MYFSVACHLIYLAVRHLCINSIKIMFEVMSLANITKLNGEVINLFSAIVVSDF